MLTMLRIAIASSTTTATLHDRVERQDADVGWLMIGTLADGTVRAGFVIVNVAPCTVGVNWCRRARGEVGDRPRDPTVFMPSVPSTTGTIRPAS